MKNCSVREVGNVVLDEFYKQATKPTAMQVKSDGFYSTLNCMSIIHRMLGSSLYQLTRWSGVPLHKLTVPQLVMKSPIFMKTEGLMGLDAVFIGK
jgi:hypothetical protein